MQQGESPYAETALAINTGACTKVARRSPKPLVVGSIPNRPCQAREKKPMIAADLFANRFGVSWSEVSLACDTGHRKTHQRKFAGEIHVYP